MVESIDHFTILMNLGNSRGIPSMIPTLTQNGHNYIAKLLLKQGAKQK